MGNFSGTNYEEQHPESNSNDVKNRSTNKAMFGCGITLFMLIALTIFFYWLMQTYFSPDLPNLPH
jgi:hypothetical protein